MYAGPLRISVKSSNCSDGHVAGLSRAGRILFSTLIFLRDICEITSHSGIHQSARVVWEPHATEIEQQYLWHSELNPGVYDKRADVNSISWQRYLTRQGYGYYPSSRTVLITSLAWNKP